MSINIFKSSVFFLKRWISLLRFKQKIKKKGGKCGKGRCLTHPECVQFETLKMKSGFRIECYPEYAGKKSPPPLIIFNNNVIIQYDFTALVANRIEIGSNTILASNVSLISENHSIEVETNIPFFAQPLKTGPIKIGEGCWLGQNVVVLPNVTIGDKCVIGANSVVTKDIPSYSIAAGVPAKVIKKYDFTRHCWIRL